MLALMMSMLSFMPQAHAHEGHDEAEHAPVAEVAPQTPRLSYQSPRIESVALIDSQGLVIWVDDYASNRPLADLAVSVRVGSSAVQAQQVEAGTYRVPLDLLGGKDQPEYALDLSLRGKDWEEHYQGRLPRPPVTDYRAPPSRPAALLSIAISIAVALAIITFFAWRRRPRA